MKTLVAILISLLFIQGYFLNNNSKKNTALIKEHEDAVLAISYHEKKNSKIMKLIEFAENKNADMDAQLREQKIVNSELKTKNDALKHSINQFEQKINSQTIFIQQKDSEILVLKNELLKYISE
jgi:predicted RNase H-like nuclease (RuvC/YqgF family)